MSGSGFVFRRDRHLLGGHSEQQGEDGKVKKSRRKRHDQTKIRALSKELREYEQEGTQLYLEGRPCESADIVNACVFAEEQNYMRDYISDDSQHIRKINFIKVRHD